MKQSTFCLIGSFLFLFLTFNMNAFAIVQPEKNHSPYFIPHKVIKPAIQKFSSLRQLVYKLNLKLQKAKKGSVILVVIAALLTTFLLAFALYIGAYGGASTALLVAIGAVGLALIIFGTAKIISNIYRKRRTT